MAFLPFEYRRHPPLFLTPLACTDILNTPIKYKKVSYCDTTLTVDIRSLRTTTRNKDRHTFPIKKTFVLIVGIKQIKC